MVVCCHGRGGLSNNPTTSLLVVRPLTVAPYSLYGAAMKRSALEARGFEGFLTTRELSAGRMKEVPVFAGIYVVVSCAIEEPSFLASSIGGHHKGKNPTVAVSMLESRWVAATDVCTSSATFGLFGPFVNGHFGGRLSLPA